MERKLVSLVGMTLLATILCHTAHADPGGLAIGAKASTLGVGGEVTANIVPNLNCRFGGNWLGFDFDAEESDIEYNLEVDLLSFSALLDWHVFNNSFRISGGLFYNDSAAAMTGQLADSVTIGGTVYTPAEIGTLSGRLSFPQELAPYVGIGWGNPFDSKGRLSLMLDLGVLFVGSLSIDLTASGPIASDPTFIANLEAERADAERELNNYKFYPVLALSLVYRF